MNIAIIGCGWLGQQIGAYFKNRNHTVYGSYRNAACQDALVQQGISPFYFDLEVANSLENDLIEAMDVWVIALPPIRKGVRNFYGDALQMLARQFSLESRVIFTSSTGVYPQESGIFKEDYTFDTESESSVLLAAETRLREVLGDRLTILRLGGLIGPFRHPIRFLAGREMKDDGMCPINLVHSRDILRLLEVLLDSNAFGATYNVVYPLKMSKKDYYHLMAIKYGLERPVFKAVSGLNRSINGELVTFELGFDYQFNPVHFRESIT